MIYFVSRVFIHKNEVNRKHLSKSLKDLTAQLEKLYDERINEEKFSALGKIAANIGHEINNPLTISTANLDKLEFLLNSNEFNQRDIERTVKNLKVANNRIQRITKGLKTYSRSSCHEMVPVNLNLATQQAVDLIDDMYLKEGVVVKYRFNDENINILGDLGKFQQILFNLIQNAKDATEGYDDRSIDISLQVNRNSKKVKLYVADNGCGIPEDVLPKIFEPLFTTKKIGKGTGLGLGIVSQLVFEMKGDIKVDTRPHSGTTFKIEFPLIEVESSLSTDPTTELGKEKNQNHIKLSAKSKILVVDDESEIRAFLQEVLESYEFVVECAGDEVEARRAIRKHDFDIVFTDLKMLGFDGIEFSKEVKRVNQETKVVLMTGMVLNASQRKARTVDFHLEKPFDLETLIQFISEKEKFQNNNKSVA
ncbi:MAG: response regulator [Bdellovibrionales bacterium]|nr:response regulator [Bdellovibrionales bacterium]